MNSKYKIHDTLMGTYSGHTLDVTAPLPEDIYAIDIAHHLAYQCRYGGATTKFYSVAEHSLIVSEHVPDELKPYALLHDASEAYVTDIPRGLKHSVGMSNYRALEMLFTEVIAIRFGLDWTDEIHREIDAVDKRLILDESKALLQGWERYYLARPGMEPVGATIYGYNPEVAERKFVDAFFNLFPEQFEEFEELDTWIGLD